MPRCIRGLLGRLAGDHGPGRAEEPRGWRSGVCRPQPPRGSSTSGTILQTKVKGESPRVQLQKKLKMSAFVINSLNITNV